MRTEPVRTCVACRKEAGKRTLIRVVRKHEGGAAVDPSGSIPGRGAYLHVDANCVESARKRKALDRALNTTVDGALWAQLSERTKPG
jgi:predicted RNA-binding protein YlxR (DUF448 family)